MANENTHISDCPSCRDLIVEIQLMKNKDLINEMETMIRNGCGSDWFRLIWVKNEISNRMREVD